MKSLVIVAFMVAAGSVVSQAAGFTFSGQGQPPVGHDQLWEIPALMILKRQALGPAGVHGQLVRAPRSIWVTLSDPDGRHALPNDPPRNGTTGVPEPEGLGSLLAMGMAASVFLGFRFKQRRLFRGAA